MHILQDAHDVYYLWDGEVVCSLFYQNCLHQ